MSTDREATDLTISQAARRLGVSENAVRQRIKHGTLAAAKVDGLWRITLPDRPPDRKAGYHVDQPPDHEGDSQIGYQTDQEIVTSAAVSPSARAQLEAVRDEWLAPLVAQIREQAEEIGQLRAERGAVERQRDALAAELIAERALRAQIAELATKVEQRELEHQRGAEQLVDLLQRDRNEAQRRVADLEQQLKQLTAGGNAQDVPGSRQDAPGAAEGPDATEGPLTGLRAWWRRVFGGAR